MTARLLQTWSQKLKFEQRLTRTVYLVEKAKCLVDPNAADVKPFLVDIDTVQLPAGMHQEAAGGLDALCGQGAGGWWARLPNHLQTRVRVAQAQAKIAMRR